MSIYPKVTKQNMINLAKRAEHQEKEITDKIKGGTLI